MVKSLKIAHVTPYYLPAWRYGGPIRSVHGLCRSLVVAGHEVHVFTTNVDGAGNSDVPLGRPVDVDGVKVWYFTAKRLRRLYWSPSLIKAFKRCVSDFDIVHIHAVFLLPTMQAARAALKAKVPYVVAPRGVLVRALFRRKSYLIKTLWMALFDNFTIEHAAAVHVTSQREADEMAHFGLKIRKTFVVPNGVDVPNAADGAPVSPEITRLLTNDAVVLFLGRVSWEKGIDRLIRAMFLLPRCTLVIAGNEDSAYGQQMRDLAAQLSVGGRVLFVGPVHGADKLTLLSRAKMLVLPSYSENFGNVVLEAMAVGCPVVVTEEVGAADVVRESGCGVVSGGAPEDLASSIRAILSDRNLREKMGESGRLAVSERYAWHMAAKKMIEVYQKVISDGRGT